MAKRKEYCSKNVNEPFNQELVRDYKWQQMHPVKDEDFLVHMKLNKNNKAVNSGDNHLKKANKVEIEEVVVQQVPKIISPTQGSPTSKISDPKVHPANPDVELSLKGLSLGSGGVQKNERRTKWRRTFEQRTKLGTK